MTSVAGELPAVPGAVHHWAQVGDLRVHYAAFGAGRPVVLLHGWPQHWYAWRRVATRLADRFQVLCPDLRGQGWSSAPPDGYDKPTLAADLLAFCDVLELERPDVIGHDWGGWVAVLGALSSPGRFRSVVAAGIAHPWQRWDTRVLDAWRFGYQVALAAPYTGSLLLRGVPGAVPALIRGATVRQEAFDDADLRAYAEPLREPARARASVALYRTFLLSEGPRALLRTSAPRLVTPTRFVVGTGDPVITRRLMAGWEGHGDDLGLTMVAQCGHFVPEEQPDAILAAFADASSRA